MCINHRQDPDRHKYPISPFDGISGKSRYIISLVFKYKRYVETVEYCFKLILVHWHKTLCF